LHTPQYFSARLSVFLGNTGRVLVRADRRNFAAFIPRLGYGEYSIANQRSVCLHLGRTFLGMVFRGFAPTDLNIDNRLGFSGRVAGAFFRAGPSGSRFVGPIPWRRSPGGPGRRACGQVMSEMNHPAAYPVQPRNFKQVVGEFNETFKGCGPWGPSGVIRSFGTFQEEDEPSNQTRSNAFYLW